MDDLLREWGEPEEIISTFIRHDITPDILDQLDDQFLKELVPSVGARIRLRGKIKNYIEFNNRNIEDGSIVNINLTSPCTSVASTVTVNSGTSQDLDVVDDGVVSFDLNELLQGPPTYTEFDLKSLLQNSPMGQGILNYYDKNATLDDLHSKRLVEIIIRHLYHHIIKYRLKPFEYERISKKITRLFPNENASDYYTPASKKNGGDGSSSVYQQGRLVNKVRNIVTRCEEAVPLRKKRKLNGNVTAEEANINEKDYDADGIRDIDLDESVLWLKLNSEPWSTVMDKWNYTFSLRRKTKSDSVQQFLEYWPVLYDLRAESLIEADFQNLFPNSTLSFFKKWDHFIEKIIAIRKANITNSSVSEEIQGLEKISDEDGKFLTELWILPYLISPKGRLVLANKEVWKFSTIESVEGLVVQAKDAADIHRVLETVRERAIARGQKVQPYLLVEGETLKAPNNFYVIVDTVRYQFKSSKKAFDVLFKIFHVLSAKYPAQSEYIWIIIQKVIYNIHTPYDKIPVGIQKYLNILD